MLIDIKIKNIGLDLNEYIQIKVVFSFDDIDVTKKHVYLSYDTNKIGIFSVFFVYRVA